MTRAASRTFNRYLAIRRDKLWAAKALWDDFLHCRSDVDLQWEMLTHPALWGISGLITVSAMWLEGLNVDDGRSEVEDSKMIIVSAQTVWIVQCCWLFLDEGPGGKVKPGQLLRVAYSKWLGCPARPHYCTSKSHNHEEKAVTGCADSPCPALHYSNVWS